MIETFPGDSGRHTRVALAAIAIAALAAFANSFQGPFIFDDLASIVNNPTIRDLRQLGAVFSPPFERGATVGGRPILNLSFALNYAISGPGVWSYHAINLVIHILSGWLLFGLVHRTLLLDGPLRAHALSFAGWTALLWVVHPLQTESVTYIVQRAESLSGMFYLLTVYAFVRGATGDQPRRWFSVAALACGLGVGTKETVATAPLMVLLYDRIFLSGGFATALRRRVGLYTALAASWVLIIGLMVSHHSRGDTAGFGLSVTPWSYGLAQVHSIVLYLRLSVFPFPLVFDHDGIVPFEKAYATVAFGLAIASGIVVTGLALIRGRAIALAGAWFFLILAPTSSIVPLFDSLFEHRMYLASAAPVLLIVGGAFVLLGGRAGWLLAAVAAAFGVLTAGRNEVYRSADRIWRDTIARRPQGARAYFELGNVYMGAGNPAAAIEAYRGAIRVRPHYIEAHSNLGAALLQAGRPEEALAKFEEAIRMNPQPYMHFAAAMCASQLQRTDLALAHYNEALRLDPHYIEALNNRGNLYLQRNDPRAALADYEAVLRIVPKYVDAHLNAAAALVALRQWDRAREQCEFALRLRPDYSLAYGKLGDIGLESNRLDEAIAHYRQALRLDPQQVYSRYNLGRALALSERPAEARAEYEQLLQIAPGFVAARYELALLLEASGQIEAAIAQLEMVLKLQPGQSEVETRLARLRKTLSGAQGNKP